MADKYKVIKEDKGDILNRSDNKFNQLFGTVKDKAKGKAGEVEDKFFRGIDSRINTLRANIKVKEGLEDLLEGYITEEELAFSLADDEAMREAMDKVTDGIINPDPIQVIDRSAVAFDVSHGISVFWKELNAPIQEKVDLAVNVKEINDQVEEGMNPENSPTARRRILHDLGIEGTEMNQLVTQEDDAIYQKKVVDHYRNEHMERLGLKDKDILDPADEELLDNLVEDSIAMPDGYRLDIVRVEPENENLIDPYEEAFGLTAEQFIETYALEDGYNRFDYPPFDELDRIDEFPSMKYAMEEYDRLHGVTLEENIEELEEIVGIQEAINKTQLNHDDLADLDQPAPEQKHGDDNVPPAQRYDDSQAPPEEPSVFAPPVLSDDDLQNLEDWNDLQY